MPQITGLVTSDGPVLNVEIAIRRSLERNYLQRGLAVPKPIAAKALIDTGASNCAVRSGIAAALGLPRINVTPVMTGSHVVRADVYSMRLILDQQHEFEFDFLEMGAPGSPIQCFLGQEFLARGVFTQDGPAGTWIFKWYRPLSSPPALLPIPPSSAMSSPRPAPPAKRGGAK